MNIEELTALCEERGRAIYEANRHILQLTDSLNAVTRERDEAKKEAAESSKEMIMLFSDHSSIELEKQLRIEELTRERDKLQALAELGDGYRRERDEAREQAKAYNDNAYALSLGVDQLTKERDEARAEVGRLTDERDELLVRVADQGAELRATRDAYGTAYRRGAEAMREACVTTIHDGGLVWTRESAERALREIGILEEP